MAKGQRGGHRLKSTGQDPQAAHHRGEDGSNNGGGCEELGGEENSPLRATMAGGGVDGPCVGEGRGIGARAGRGAILDSRSTDVDYDLSAPSPVEAPSSCPSLIHPDYIDRLREELRRHQETGL